MPFVGEQKTELKGRESRLAAETLRQLAATHGHATVVALLEIPAVSAERVALIPHRAECGEAWLPADDDRWRAYLDTDSELVFYCPECASSEFDGGE